MPIAPPLRSEGEPAAAPFDGRRRPPPRLRLRDVRRAFRLVGDVRARGADPSRWRARMVRGLAGLLGADMVVSSELSFRRGGRSAAEVAGAGDFDAVPPPVLHDAGWGVRRDADGALGGVWEIRSEREEARPQDYHVLLGGDEDDPSDADARLPVRPRERLVAGEYSILSQLPLPHAATVDQLVCYRFAPSPPFAPAAARLLRIFHAELARFWRAQVLRAARDPAADLPPRLRQTLARLVAGDSEKQVARRLGISPHTVHNYVKALHQRFEVSSRGELLAAARAGERGAGDFRPKLTAEVAPADG